MQQISYPWKNLQQHRRVHDVEKSAAIRAVKTSRSAAIYNSMGILHTHIIEKPFDCDIYSKMSAIVPVKDLKSVTIEILAFDRSVIFETYANI